MATAATLGFLGTKGSDNSQVGEAQQLFSEQSKAKSQELMETAQCQPFSVVNFNPVELALQGEMKRYKVPSPDDMRLPRDVQRIRLPYDGKDRVGHLWTARYPHMYGKMIGAQGLGQPGEVVPQREVQYFLPITIAYTFLEHFSPIFVAPEGTVQPPSPKDARKIYGVLVFKGDIHVLENLLAMEDTERALIEVPVAHVTQIGKTSHKSYRTVQVNLHRYLERMFEGQKRFADATISRAQQKWSEDQSIRDISDSDRVWYRWAINLGYAPKPKPGEKTWLNELLLMGSDSGSAIADSRLRKCQSCKKTEPEAGTPFCSCGSPINTFETYMAGHPVADAWLMTLRGEERDVALAERKLRMQGFESVAEVSNGSATEAEPGPAAATNQATATPAPKGGKTKPAGKDNKIAPTQEIPAAASTAIPGEE